MILFLIRSGMASSGSRGGLNQIGDTQVQWLAKIFWLTTVIDTMDPLGNGLLRTQDNGRLIES